MPLKLLIIICFFTVDIPVTYTHILYKLKLYAQLVRLDKPVGIYLLLWPTLWALAIAGEGSPSAWITFVFITGVILMRSAGCAINDYADRHIDKHVKRTKDRPITSGKITPKEALMVFAALCFVAFLLVLTLNSLTIWMSLVAVALAGSYPFMKRYHYLPQVHLGAAFAWAIPMAFAAQTGEIPKIAWLLFVANLLWTTAYDTIYGMVDRDDDLALGVKSSAILFGEYDRHIIGMIQGLFVIALIMIGQKLDYSASYYWGVAIICGHFGYQHLLILYRVREYCFDAFIINHWVGAILFFAIIGQYIIW